MAHTTGNNTPQVVIIKKLLDAAALHREFGDNDLAERCEREANTLYEELRALTEGKFAQRPQSLALSFGRILGVIFAMALVVSTVPSCFRNTAPPEDRLLLERGCTVRNSEATRGADEWTCPNG